MSLLDDVSIVVTPNGYKAGTLFGVIPVPSEGAELVTNGDFATDSDWNKGTGWSISNGELVGNNATSITYQGISAQPNTFYKVTFTVSNYVSGNVLFQFNGGSNSGTPRTSVGTYTEYIATDASVNGNFSITRTQNFTGSIENVSVKEYTASDMDVTRATAATRVDENGLVNYAEIIGDEEVTNGDFATDSDWTKGAGWTISGGTASHTGGASYLSQDVLQVDTLYKVNISVTAVSGGGFVQIYMGNSPASVLISVIGDYTYYFTSQSSVTLGLALRSLGDVTIDNVSVKEAARDNVPRIDYTGGGCPHILAEPQRTNLITYSEDYDDASWTKSQTTITPNATTSPDGAVNASKLTEAALSGSHTITQGNITVTSGAEVSYSVFAKKGERDFMLLWFGQVSTGYSFDLNNGAIGSKIGGGTLTPKIEDYGNGWYKCTVTGTAPSTLANIIIYTMTAATTYSYAGDGTSGIYIWGSQLEEGSYATSYIPTSGSTVTRNQDIFSRDGIGSLINSTEGVLFVEAKAFENGNITVSNGANNDNLMVSFNVTSGRLDVNMKVGGSYQFIFNYTTSVITNNKIAIKFKENDFALWVNGVEVLTDLSGNTAAANTFDRLNFSSANAASEFFKGEVKQLQVYDTALTDTQLAALTS